MFVNFRGGKAGLPAVALLFFFLVTVPLSADSLWSNIQWSFGGNLFHFAANNGADSDPAPILPSLGFSAAIQITEILWLEVTEDIYFTNYQYNAERDYPMACSQPERSAFVMGFKTGIQLVGKIPINDNGITVRVYGGPAADFRIVTLAFGLNYEGDFTGDIKTDPQLQTNAIRNYFWSNGRFIMPVIGAGMDFPISEHFMVGFDLRAWIPIYKVWTNDDTPAIDGWRFGIGFRITPLRGSSGSN